MCVHAAFVNLGLKFLTDQGVYEKVLGMAENLSQNMDIFAQQKEWVGHSVCLCVCEATDMTPSWFIASFAIRTPDKTTR